MAFERCMKKGQIIIFARIEWRNGGKCETSEVDRYIYLNQRMIAKVASSGEYEIEMFIL